MADDKSESKSTGRPLGPTGEAVRKNIRRIRDDCGMSGPELSDGLKRLGRPIPPLGISRIENGQRRVDVDDLAAIAVTLGVSPSALLMPARTEDGAEVQASDLVEITGWSKPITARVVWEWLEAAAPLIQGTLTSFVERTWPVWERERFNAQIVQEIQMKKRERAYEGSNGDD